MKKKYNYEYSKKASYKKLSNPDYYRGINPDTGKQFTREELANMVTGARIAVRKIYNRMKDKGIQSIDLGLIEKHYNKQKDEALKIPNIANMKTKRGEYSYGKMFSELDFLGRVLNSDYFSISGAKKELQNTKDTLKERGVDVGVDFTYSDQADLWKLYSEFKDHAQVLGSPVVFETIVSEMIDGGSYEEIKSRIYQRLNDIRKTKSMAADILRI